MRRRSGRVAWPSDALIASAGATNIGGELCLTEDQSCADPAFAPALQLTLTFTAVLQDPSPNWSLNSLFESAAAGSSSPDTLSRCPLAQRSVIHTQLPRSLQEAGGSPRGGDMSEETNNASAFRFREQYKMQQPEHHGLVSLPAHRFLATEKLAPESGPSAGSAWARSRRAPLPLRPRRHR